MFNNKVSPKDYEDLRAKYFSFLSEHKLTVREAGMVVGRLVCDVEDMVCSNEYGGEMCCEGETKRPDGQCDSPVCVEKILALRPS